MFGIGYPQVQKDRNPRFPHQLKIGIENQLEQKPSGKIRITAFTKR